MAAARDLQSDSDGAVIWRPGKLFSLGDIMWKIDARIFYWTSAALARVHATVGPITQHSLRP